MIVLDEVLQEVDAFLHLNLVVFDKILEIQIFVKNNTKRKHAHNLFGYYIFTIERMEVKRCSFFKFVVFNTHELIIVIIII